MMGLMAVIMPVMVKPLMQYRKQLFLLEKGFIMKRDKIYMAGWGEVSGTVDTKSMTVNPDDNPDDSRLFIIKRDKHKWHAVSCLVMDKDIARNKDMIKEYNH